jgi:hypothetical protein
MWVNQARLFPRSKLWHEINVPTDLASSNPQAVGVGNEFELDEDLK